MSIASIKNGDAYFFRGTYSRKVAIVRMASMHDVNDHLAICDTCTRILRTDLWGTGPIGLTRLVDSATVLEGDIVVG